MTLTEQDAARLAEIRAADARVLTEDSSYSGAGGLFLRTAHEHRRFLLRLLDARPAGEFVTRETHDKLLAATQDILQHERNASHSDLDTKYDAEAQERRAGAAEARVAEFESGRAYRDSLEERDRLAAALRAIADCPAAMAPGMVWQDVADRMERYAREALQGRPT